MNGSGKTTAVDFFEKKGFRRISLSDAIREELNRENIKETRENLTKKGNELRDKFGSDILARRTIAKFLDPNNVIVNEKIVVDSIRNENEANYLKSLPGFFLVSINADQDKRFERLKKRNRLGDVTNYDDFVKQEKAEQSDNETHQQIHKVMALSDYVLNNNDSLEEFYNKLNVLYTKIRIDFNKRVRLDWDMYFLKIALIVSERSTCIRRHVGAVTVKNKQILTTGYNGAPTKTKDCLDLGYCPKEESNIPSGTGYDTCIAVHAEQNAIIQAANHGISLEGSTLYCTHSPCLICARMIVNAGITRVVSLETSFPDKQTMELFKESNIVFEKKPSPQLFITENLG